ncbi:unnamed protein product, partial [Brassica rapa subsp. trilocularis]
WHNQDIWPTLFLETPLGLARSADPPILFITNCWNFFFTWSAIDELIYVFKLL